MLSINTRKYEIEEDILLNNEDESKELFRFTMKLTSDELNKLNKALLNKDTLKLANKIKDIENGELNEEKIDEVFEITSKMNEETFKLIGELCFKENKEKFIEIGGEVKYIQMVEMISDFLLINIMKNNQKRVNTMNSELTKITKN